MSETTLLASGSPPERRSARSSERDSAFDWFRASCSRRRRSAVPGSRAIARASEEVNAA